MTRPLPPRADSATPTPERRALQDALAWPIALTLLVGAAIVFFLPRIVPPQFLTLAVGAVFALVTIMLVVILSALVERWLRRHASELAMEAERQVQTLGVAGLPTATGDSALVPLASAYADAGARAALTAAERETGELLVRLGADAAECIERVTSQFRESVRQVVRQAAGSAVGSTARSLSGALTTRGMTSVVGAPADTTSDGFAPAGTIPNGTTPADTTPAGTSPAGTSPAGTSPANTTPDGTTGAVSDLLDALTECTDALRRVTAAVPAAREPVDVVQVVRDAVAAADTLDDAGAVRLSLDTDRGMVLIDGPRIHEHVRELLRLAQHASAPSATVTVHVSRIFRTSIEDAPVRRTGDSPLTIVPRASGDELRSWVLRAQPGAEVLSVIVTDAGEPLATDLAQRAFDPFAIARPGDPLGIALATIRRTVSAARGTIWIASSREGGTAVHMLLPIVVS